MVELCVHNWVPFSWLEAAWNNRHDPGFRADDKAFMNEHKVKPFHGAVIHFEGFQEEERLVYTIQ